MALGFGGDDDASPYPVIAETEEYDGATWSEVANMSTARGKMSDFGTQTLAVGGGGGPPAVATTEEWTKAQNIKIITD